MELRYLTPLTAEEQIAHGLSAPQPLAIADRVRFSELDKQNHVNNKAYMDWFERARVEHMFTVWRPLFADLPRPRVAVHSATIRYLKEMLENESYIVTSRAESFRQSSIVLEQQIWSGDLRATLKVIAVLQMPDSHDRYVLPEGLRDYLVKVEGARPDA